MTFIRTSRLFSGFYWKHHASTPEKIVKDFCVLFRFSIDVFIVLDSEQISVFNELVRQIVSRNLPVAQMFGQKTISQIFARSQSHFHKAQRRFPLNFEKITYIFDALWRNHEFGLAEIRVVIDVFKRFLKFVYQSQTLARDRQSSL